MTDDELNRIEARANAATPWPWVAANRNEIHDRETRFDERGIRIGSTANGIATIDCTNVENNRQFIVHARKDVPALLAEVRQLCAERDVLIRYIINQHNDCPCSMGEEHCQKLDTRDYCDGGFYKDLDEECYEESFDCWLIWARNEVRKEKQT